MSSVEMAIHRVDLFMSDQCWRGDIATLPSRRLSDFFNDQMHEYCTLNGATLLTWDKGHLIEHETFAAMHVHMKNIIAAVGSFDPLKAKTDPTIRVQKQPVSVTLYAPPFTLQGQMHLFSGAQIFDAIDAARQNYVTLTNAMLMLDHAPLLAFPAELVLVNRLWITAFRATPTRSSAP
jgi:hypothetical protein